MNKLFTVKNLDELLTALKVYIKSFSRKIIKITKEEIEASGKYATPKYVDDAVDNVDLTNYVKDTDYATENNPGVVAVKSSDGLQMHNGSQLVVKCAEAGDIQKKTSRFRAVVPYNLDKAVATSIGSNTETLTEEQKKFAQEWLGITELLEEKIGTLETLIDESGVLA